MKERSEEEKKDAGLGREEQRPQQTPRDGTMNLLFCINRGFLPLFLSCMRSIVRSGGYGHYAAYVLHSDLDDGVEQAQRRDFGRQVAFHLIQVPQELFEGFPESKRYPRQIYYRLAAPMLLPRELERALYLDVDTVVINSLSPLYETDFDSNFYVGCTHTREFLTRFNQLRLRSEKAVAYINTGVLLMNLPALRESLDLQAICAYTNARKNDFILPDQDILTALYGDRVKLADTMRYNLSDRILGFYNADHLRDRIDLDWVRRNTAIIHYCGKNKPWKEGYTGTLGVFYQELFPE